MMKTRRKNERPFEVRLGARIRKLRREQAITVAELALRAGLSEAYMARIESGDAKASLVRIERIAIALGVHVAEVFAVGDSLRERVCPAILRGDESTLSSMRAILDGPR